MIKSWIAYALSTVAIIILGFVAVKTPEYPLTTVVDAIKLITIGYFAKRVAPRVVHGGRMFTKNVQSGKMNAANNGGLNED